MEILDTIGVLAEAELNTLFRGSFAAPTLPLLDEASRLSKHLLPKQTSYYLRIIERGLVNENAWA
jgi:hypothetical protein